MNSTPDPVLEVLDRISADLHQLAAQVNGLVLEYGNLRRDTASSLADSTPPARDRYVSPKGDRRERPVHCQRCCYERTWALDSLCDPCFEKRQMERAS